jgi:hypothetical protein
MEQWARGETSGVNVWRTAYTFVEEDGSNVGKEVSRIVALGSVSSGSEKTYRIDSSIYLLKQP